MAFPRLNEKEEKGWFSKAFSYVKSQFGQESAIPHHESIQSEAMEIYLEQYKCSLCDMMVMDIEETTREILQIFTKLNDRRIWIEKKPFPEPWLCKQLTKVYYIHVHVITCITGCFNIWADI